jgi:hypothetical protein
MEFDPEAYRRRRESFLTVLLVVLGGTAILFCDLLLTGGVFLFVLLTTGLIAAAAGAHYLLWGQAFSQQVAGEREEAELRDRLEGNAWELPEPQRPRHD